MEVNHHSKAMKPAILLGGIFLLLPGSTLQDSRPAQQPVDVFKDLAGHWDKTLELGD